MQIHDFRTYVNPRNGKRLVEACIICGTMKENRDNISCDTRRENSLDKLGWELKR